MSAIAVARAPIWRADEVKVDSSDGVERFKNLASLSSISSNSRTLCGEP